MVRVERKGWNWKQRAVTGQTLSSLKERSNSCPKPIGGTKSKTAHNLTPEKSRRSELEPQLESRKVTTSSSTWRNCLVRVLSFQNPFFWFRVPFFFLFYIVFVSDAFGIRVPSFSFSMLSILIPSYVICSFLHWNIYGCFIFWVACQLSQSIELLHFFYLPSFPEFALCSVCFWKCGYLFCQGYVWLLRKNRERKGKLWN